MKVGLAVVAALAGLAVAGPATATDPLPDKKPPKFVDRYGRTPSPGRSPYAPVLDAGTAVDAGPASAGRRQLFEAGSEAGSDAGSDAGVDAQIDADIDEELIAVVDDAIERLARIRNREGLAHFERKAYPEALAGFRGAYELDPKHPEYTNNLAYLYDVLGNRADAERFYRITIDLEPARGVAHLNLADLLMAEGATIKRLGEAAVSLIRARELRGNLADIIIRQARVAMRRGRYEEAERFFREAVAATPPDDALRLEIGDFFREFGREQEALSWYRQVKGEVWRDEAAGRIREVEVEREARRFGWAREIGEVPARARMLATKGRVLHNEGHHAEAERLFREAIEMAPHFAMARAELGDLLRATERLDGAELAYLRAAATEQGNAEIYARLGELYLAWPDESRAAEATLFLDRAHQLRPDWTELHLRLAHAWRAAGELRRALYHVEQLLARARAVGTPAAVRQEAAALRETLRQLVPEIVEADPGEADHSAPDADRSALREALDRARGFLAQGEPDAAMAELRRLADADRVPAVLNLEARILHGTGRLDAAAKVLVASLGREADQSDVHEQLGLIRKAQDRVAAARAHFVRAEALGAVDATWHIAWLDAGSLGTGEGWRWFEDAFALEAIGKTRSRIDRYLSRAAATSVYVDRARGLRRALQRRVESVYLGAVTIALLLLVGLVAIRIRLWGGLDLLEFAERYPESGPEVQRVLSAIRHEVLKHNTMVLTGLVRAIERGEPASEKAAWCRRSLFGGGAGGEAVVRRMHGYVEELAKIGRTHRVRLNLKRKDAGIAALVEGFRVLGRVAPLMDRVDRLSSFRRRRLLRGLETAARLLNTEAYEAVRGLLDKLRVLEVDRVLLQQIFERTAAEPALAGVPLAPLVLDTRIEFPVGVPIPRRAFHDILANLMRNAIQSSRISGGGLLVEIGLRVEAEVDMVTALERVVFSVLDRAPEALTSEMLRGRFIEEGLGLTSDLVSRFEGTLDVRTGAESGDGDWTKAVVVKLPRAYSGGADVFTAEFDALGVN